jgi:cytosine/adenosine deaminase-related metal-dependent hydrolase
MEIQTLRYVVTLAEELHFGRAAERHFISAQPFGQHIQRLEREIGTRLFERTSRRVALTAAGERFVERARTVPTQVELLREIAGEDAPLDDGGLRVGVLGFGAADYWHDLRTMAAMQQPGLTLVYHDLNLVNQYDAVRQGEVDVAVVQYVGDLDGLDFEPIFSSPRVAVLPASSSPAYTPADVHLGNLLGAVEALESGVTTILDFSHCNNTPEHSDAAVTGLLDAGIRAVFGYGFFESSPTAPPHFTDHGARLRDFARIADTYFTARTGLVTLGAALTEVGVIPLSATAAEVHAARERAAVQVTRTGCVWGLPNGITELDAAGLLGPDQVHVHCNTLTEGEWQVLARVGAKISISVETELNMGMGRPVFAACQRHGLAPTLSCDIISLGSGDLFSQLRQGLGFKRWAGTEAVNLSGADPDRVSTTALEALCWPTVNAAEAIGLGDRIGSLTPGKQADLIIVGGPGTSQHPVTDAAGTLIFQRSADSGAVRPTGYAQSRARHRTRNHPARPSAVNP